jgi:hypothetical protein
VGPDAAWPYRISLSERSEAGEIRRRMKKRDGSLAAGEPSRLYSVGEQDYAGGLRPPAETLLF